MSLEIVPFVDKMLPEAAELLAASHRRMRALEPVLPVAYESPEEALKPLEEAFRAPGSAGYAALRSGRISAYLLGVARLRDRVLSMPYHGHALAADQRPEVFREMYALLADDFVRRGYFGHGVGLLAADMPEQESWDWLSFGRGLVLAISDLTEPLPEVTGLDVRQVGPEGLEDVVYLQDLNWQHHSRPPIYNLYFDDLAPVRTQVTELLADPENGHFVAYEDGRPVALNSFMKSSWVPTMLMPEGGIYLFQGIVAEDRRRGGIGRAILARSLRWARDRGYRWCLLHVFPTNIPGLPFWLSNGFRPLEQSRYRLIDDRVIWARPRP